jgi:sulfate permease, SulP family
VVVAALCLASLLLLRWRLPKLPGALLVVVAAIAASAALGLASEGVATVGEIPSGLPGLALPTAPVGDLLALVPAALGIFFVSFSDEILTARSFAGHRGQHGSADTELTAMGAASLAAGITQGFPIGASGSRTAVKRPDGRPHPAVRAARRRRRRHRRRRRAAVPDRADAVPAQGGPWRRHRGCGHRLVDRGAWQGLARTSQVEVAIAAVTMAGVVAVGVLEALLVAVALSIVDGARRSATPHDTVLGWVEPMGRYANVRFHPRAQVTPGVLVYRLFFANASYVKGRVREALHGAPAPVRWFVFDAEALTRVDATGMDALTSLVQSLQEEGITFVFARLKDPTRQTLQEGGVLDLVGEPHVYLTVRTAVAAAAAGEEQQ